MSYWILGIVIRTINRLCLIIGGFSFLLSKGRVIVDWQFWALLAVVWVGLLAEWIVAEMRQAISKIPKPAPAPVPERTSAHERKTRSKQKR